MGNSLLERFCCLEQEHPPATTSASQPKPIATLGKPLVATKTTNFEDEDF